MAATIEYVEQIIATFKEATAANLHTPARHENVVTLTPEIADECLVTADLHGHRRNFNLIQKLADLERHPRRHLILQEVCHGGPTFPANGGCMSHIMLEDVARLKARYPERVHFLLSNHEWAELVDYPILKARRMLNLVFRLGLQQSYGALAEKVREAFVPFIRSCPLAVRLPGGIFICHSIPEQVDRTQFDYSLFDRPLDSADLQEHSDLFWLLWGRDYRPENAKAFAQRVNANVLINGHEPCPDGHSIPNDTQIILDCCGDNACYLKLPVGETLTHAEIVRRIQKL